MKLIKDLTGNYSDCIVTYFDFESHVEKHKHLTDSALSIGYNCMWNQAAINYIKDYKIKIFFNGEHPCSFTQELKYGHRGFDIDENFTHVYTICPYTADWINKVYNAGQEKFKRVLFPIDQKNIVESEKIYDTVFYGSICGGDHVEAVKAMQRFKYNFFTLGPQHWHPNPTTTIAAAQEVATMVTHVNVHTFDKWKVLSQTKVVPIYNQLYLHPHHVENIKKYDRWEENIAWSHVDELKAPQLKPRITEAALFKMLMLVKRDPWNAIEYWYEPDKDFIYFDSNEELPDLIHETTTNWENYQHIVENAYKKAYNNYTTEALLDRMIKETHAIGITNG